MILIHLPILFSVLLTSCGTTQDSYKHKGKEYHIAPNISIEALDLTAPSPWTITVIKEALQIRSESKWPKYVFGSSSPKKGGFDCSGAIYYMLQRLDITPPRTSAAQYLWLLKSGTLHHVSPKTQTLSHSDYRFLKPGDLVFWSGTYRPTDNRTVKVTHVGMYLGNLKSKYSRPVMICASKGRYFQGKRRDGYGIYDFKIPSPRSKAKIVAYGSIPKTGGN